MFKRCASGSERERHCARILRKFRESTVAPYATLPYARASKAHRPTKLNLQNLQNLLTGPSTTIPRAEVVALESASVLSVGELLKRLEPAREELQQRYIRKAEAEAAFWRGKQAAR